MLPPSDHRRPHGSRSRVPESLSFVTALPIVEPRTSTVVLHTRLGHRNLLDYEYRFTESWVRAIVPTTVCVHSCGVSSASAVGACGGNPFSISSSWLSVVRINWLSLPMAVSYASNVRTKVKKSPTWLIASA